MLLRFGVENHRSIRNYQELLMTAAPFKERGETLLMSTDQKTSVVPTAAVYGANAAGKSTILDAMQFMRSSIVSSHSMGPASGGTPYVPFLLDDDSRTKPSRYDVDLEIDDTRYHYGFKLDGKRVNEEWLIAIPLTKARRSRQTWFHRVEGESSIYFGKELKGENKLIEKIVRDNSLFLSAAAQNAHPQLLKIYEYFQRRFMVPNLPDLAPSLGMSVARFFSAHQQFEAQAIEFLKAGDTGISGISYTDLRVSDKAKTFLNEFNEILKRHSLMDSDEILQDRKTAALSHRGSNGKEYKLDIDRESAGTKAMLSTIGPILMCLESGGLLVVDELSNSLHPLMSRKIVGLFSDPSINVGKAQLIFSTHDTNLLCDNLFRRDQIWFAEKDREGTTHLYPLTNIEVDKRANVEKGYLHGRFGAIPFFSVIDEAWMESDEVQDANSEQLDG